MAGSREMARKVPPAEGGEAGTPARSGPRPSARVAAELERKLGEIRDLLGRPGGDRVAYREGLGKSLRAAHEIRRWSLRSPLWAAALEAAYGRHGVEEPRRGSNPCTRVVKLCFPGRRPADNNRYAG